MVGLTRDRFGSAAPQLRQLSNIQVCNRQQGSQAQISWLTVYLDTVRPGVVYNSCPCTTPVQAVPATSALTQCHQVPQCPVNVLLYLLDDRGHTRQGSWHTALVEGRTINPCRPVAAAGCTCHLTLHESQNELQSPHYGQRAQDKRGTAGIEPATSRTLSENHTTRPSSRSTNSSTSEATGWRCSSRPVAQS